MLCREAKRGSEGPRNWEEQEATTLSHKDEGGGGALELGEPRAARTMWDLPGGRRIQETPLDTGRASPYPLLLYILVQCLPAAKTQTEANAQGPQTQSLQGAGDPFNKSRAREG